MLENLDIKINNQMLSIISEIDEFKGSWKLLGKMAPEKLRALKKVATIESVGSSNRIEGNKLTDKQVEELLSRIKKQSFANRDEEEVAGYAKLADTIFEDWEVIPLSENYIKQLRRKTMRYLQVTVTTTTFGSDIVSYIMEECDLEFHSFDKIYWEYSHGVLGR